MGLLERIAGNRQKRKHDEFRDNMIAGMVKSGMSEEDAEVLSSVKGKDPSSLMSALNSGAAMLTRIREASEKGIAQKAKDAADAAAEKLEATEAVKRLPVITEAASVVAKEKSEITAAGGAKLQELKAQELSKRSGDRAETALNTSFDAVLNFDDEQFTRHGLKPGNLFGLTAFLTPSQLNRYKDAASAASVESAAIVGRQIIPAARGVNMVGVFKKSSAQLGKTIETNASNVAFTNANLFAGALTDNIMEFDVRDNKNKPIQDIIIDPRTGRTLSNSTKRRRVAVINKLKNDFRRTTQDLYEMAAFKRNPNLLEEGTRNKIITGLPRFKNSDEGQDSIEPGEKFTVLEPDGTLGVYTSEEEKEDL